MTRTVTLLLFFGLVIFTRVPKGSVLCAMVSASGLKASPLAVLRPANLRPYQAILPVSLAAALAAVGGAEAAALAAAG